jgi:SAM-dependent methyltransferase
VYRWVAIPPAAEDPVEVEDGITIARYLVGDRDLATREALTFLERLPEQLELSGRSVLDVGCGTGELCFELARRGAGRVLGVDLGDAIKLAIAARHGMDAELPVEFRRYGGDLREIGDERFDVVVSKDCFEHYGAVAGSPDAERMVCDMGERLVDGGLLVIGFGPLWKAPLGGHLGVRVPWAHLIFPEDVIFDEFRRVRPPGKSARTFEEGTLVNRMTLERFRRLMDDSGLQPVAVRTNVSRNRVVAGLRVLARFPPLEEYCTQNVYGIWRRPEGWSSPRDRA